MDVATIQIGYIPRVGTLEPRIRLTILRKSGSGIVEIRSSAIEDICCPQSESSADVLAAFRRSIPTLMGFLRRIVDDTPAGGVTIVTKDRVRLQLVAERHGVEPLYFEPAEVTESLKVQGKP